MNIKHVESKQNNMVKHLQKLKTKKGRFQNQQYIIDGLRIVNHAIEHGLTLVYLIVSQSFSETEHFSQFDGHVEVVYIVPDSLLKSIVDTESPQGVIAVVNMENKTLGSGKILFLDEVQDPGNIGTLIRTADAAGFTGVILKKGCTDPYAQKALRSSMGSIMSIPILINQSEEILETLDGYTIYGAALEGGVSYKKMHYPDQAVLVIGNEGNGISKSVLNRCNKKVYIPMIGAVESLNASIAGGILMFEMQSTCE